MYGHMDFEARLRWEEWVANVTAELFRWRIVSFYVRLQSRFQSKCFATEMTAERFFSSMRPDMAILTKQNPS